MSVQTSSPDSCGHVQPQRCFKKSIRAQSHLPPVVHHRGAQLIFADFVKAMVDMIWQHFQGCGHLLQTTGLRAPCCSWAMVVDSSDLFVRSRNFRSISRSPAVALVFSVRALPRPGTDLRTETHLDLQRGSDKHKQQHR